MKQKVSRAVLFSALLAVQFASGCSREGDGTPAGETAAVPSTTVSATASAAARAGLARAEFAVEGMTCGGCEIGTRKVLARLDGVKEVGASYEKGRAWAVYDPAKVSPAQMIDAIATLKYTATQVRS